MTTNAASSTKDLKGYQIYKSLSWLNGLPRAEAESVFRDCCGSDRWASRMAAERPFAMLEELFWAAERIWWSLTRADHLEAFSAHPKIGSTKGSAKQQTRSKAWSAGEQSGAATAHADTLRRLAEANRLYEERFGFIFIVCASGKSAEEMLAICKARLGNSPETELRLAAVEQQKITEIRLGKLLER